MKENIQLSLSLAADCQHRLKSVKEDELSRLFCILEISYYVYIGQTTPEAHEPINLSSRY